MGLPSVSFTLGAVLLARGFVRRVARDDVAGVDVPALGVSYLLLRVGAFLGDVVSLSTLARFPLFAIRALDVDAGGETGCTGLATASVPVSKRSG
jgi:hypothetical protein